jgi:uncharacterized membrane protein YedE/YeeE
MKFLTSFIAGLLFGIGLIVAQMVNPQKVLNFLDITSSGKGGWDGSLMLVMGAGLVVFSSGYFFLIKPRNKPMLAEQFFIPERKLIDNKLLLGAVFFGLGWGLTGICPGPAVTSILSANPKLFVFIGFMLVGMCSAKFAIKWSEKSTEHSTKAVVS